MIYLFSGGNAIGSIYAMLAAGMPMSPEEVGIPLDYVAYVAETRVMQTLMEIERLYPRIGSAMFLRRDARKGA